jgi:hypothetical protein
MKMNKASTTQNQAAKQEEEQGKKHKHTLTADRSLFIPTAATNSKASASNAADDATPA